MKFRIYAERILCDKIKLGLIIILIAVPLADVVHIAYQTYAWGLPTPYPAFATFSCLYTVGTNHLLYKIVFWFLPIYLLIITGEDSLEDYDTGYTNVLKSRMSRNSYIISKGKNSFFFSFLIIFTAMLLNLIAVYIVFRHGTEIRINPDDYPDQRLFNISYSHPLLTNIIYILIESVFAGLLGLIGNVLSMIIHERKIVYPVTFMLWFVFILVDNGLSVVLRPFPLDDFDVVAPSFFAILIGYIAISAVAIIAEVKSDEI